MSKSKSTRTKTSNPPPTRRRHPASPAPLGYLGSVEGQWLALQALIDATRRLLADLDAIAAFKNFNEFGIRIEERPTLSQLRRRARRKAAGS
jgi:hypothetical protein